jgi:hypothetical protein
MKASAFVICLALIAAGASLATPSTTLQRTFVLTTVEGLELRNVTADAVTYRGRSAVRFVETPRQGASDEKPSLAVLPNSDFDNGVIEVELAGKPRGDAADTARGFVGIAFHVGADAAQFECFYLRPTNARSNDQLRRNHSTQYTSFPEYPWHRLRKEKPGVYESYVDLAAGEWTRIRVEVAGTTAKLYVNDAPQPALIVNDLKLGASRGKVALWIGDGTEAYFSKVVVRELDAAPKKGRVQ